MYRFLVVENLVPLSHDIATELKSVFPDSEVTIAVSIRDALRAIKTGPEFDLITLDLHFDENADAGFDVLSLLKENGKSWLDSVVVYSAFADRAAPLMRAQYPDVTVVSKFGFDCDERLMEAARVTIDRHNS